MGNPVKKKLFVITTKLQEFLKIYSKLYYNLFQKSSLSEIPSCTTPCKTTDNQVVAKLR